MLLWVCYVVLDTELYKYTWPNIEKAGGEKNKHDVSF